MNFILIILLLALASCSSKPKRKQDSLLDSIAGQGIIKVGTTGDYPPFSYKKSKDTHYSGIDIDLANNLGKSLGVKVEFIPTTWKNLLKDLETQKFHIAMTGISKKLSRQKVGFFSKGYIDNGKIPISRCENKSKFNSLEKINSQTTRVIVNPGGTNETFAKEHLNRANVQVFKDNRLIFDEIIKNRADVMVTDSVEVAFQAKLHKGILCSTSKKTFSTGEIAILLPRDIILKEYIDTWLHLLTKSGKKKEIFQKYIDYE